MTGPCPHYTHTDRQVGSVVSHVCRDCLAPLADCEELAARAEPMPAFEPVVEVSLEELAEEELAAIFELGGEG